MEPDGFEISGSKKREDEKWAELDETDRQLMGDIIPPPSKQSYCSYSLHSYICTGTYTIYMDHTQVPFSYTEASENMSMLVTVQWKVIRWKVIRGTVAPKVKGVSLPWIPWASTATWEQTRCRHAFSRTSMHGPHTMLYNIISKEDYNGACKEHSIRHMHRIMSECSAASGAYNVNIMHMLPTYASRLLLYKLST